MNTLYRSALLALLFVSYPASSGSSVKCQARDGAISYADSSCPSGYSQLTTITHQARKIKPPAFPESLVNAAEFPDDGSAPIFSTYVFQARFSQLLSAISQLKISMAQHMMVEGNWPDKLEQLEFNPNSRQISLVYAAKLTKKGRINIKLNRELGNNKEIWLFPEQQGSRIEWSCYTNFPRSLLQSTAGFELCESRNF